MGSEFGSHTRQLQIKGSREIKFSHGGHLFACAVGLTTVNIYNFYTDECPTYNQCKGHVNKVRCIDWFENDMCFTSCGLDGNIFYFDLLTLKEANNGQRVNDKDFTQKGVLFTSVVNIPGKPFEVYAVGNDRKIWHSKDPKNGFETGVSIS
jgi:WD40 repeat protein